MAPEIPPASSSRARLERAGIQVTEPGTPDLTFSDVAIAMLADHAELLSGLGISKVRQGGARGETCLHGYILFLQSGVELAPVFLTLEALGALRERFTVYGTKLVFPFSFWVMCYLRQYDGILKHTRTIELCDEFSYEGTHLKLNTTVPIDEHEVFKELRAIWEGICQKSDLP